MDVQEIPEELLSLIGLARELDGALLIYKSDHVVWSNQEARQIHHTLDWSKRVTFDCIFHEAIKHGRMTDPAILRNPDGHLAFAKVARSWGQNFQFRRQYDAIVYDRYHVAFDSDWNAQVWVKGSKPFGSADNSASSAPLEITQVIEQRRIMNRMSSLLEQMGVAMAVVSVDSRLVNCSTFMARRMDVTATFPLTCDDKGRVIARDSGATTKLRQAVRAVSRRRETAALVPVGSGRHVAVLAAPETDNVIIVVQESPAPDAFGRILEAAYGLNDREAEVAIRLSAGEAPDDIAAALDRKIETVRRQITTAKTKIAAGRQHDLAHIVTRAAALFGGISPSKN